MDCLTAWNQVWDQGANELTYSCRPRTALSGQARSRPLYSGCACCLRPAIPGTASPHAPCARAVVGAMRASWAVPVLAAMVGTHHARHIARAASWSCAQACGKAWARACARNCSEAVSSREGSRAAGAAFVATGFGAAGSGANATCTPAQISAHPALQPGTMRPALRAPRYAARPSSWQLYATT